MLTKQREQRRPTAVYVPENNGGSPALTIDSPLAATRKIPDNEYAGT